MNNPLYDFFSPFADKKFPQSVPVFLLRAGAFGTWIKKQDARIKSLCAHTGFMAQEGRTLVARDAKGDLQSILVGAPDNIGPYDSAPAIAAIRQAATGDSLKKLSFHIEGDGLSSADLENAHIGWAMGCYQFSLYKKISGANPVLSWARGINRARVLSKSRSAFFLRNLINAPSNAMGPDELEDAARHIAKKGGAKIAVIHDKELLAKNFPLVYAVGQASDRRPRLIDLQWGDPKNPKLTLVGKGVCFDTGGLNIKPTPSMALMKKDMGGAAHALALGGIIMDSGLPVRLRVLIPAVENSIGGSAFRPGDIFHSRKGLTVENTNTDAEGRLILADALTYACEEKPDLLIDFATLTGSARVALGPEIPPFFTNSDAVADQLNKVSFLKNDPVWRMPLWKPYRKMIESPVADYVNSSSIPGDLIYSAVFLEQFLLHNPDWLHLDIFAWELNGRPGRPKGGAETGLWATLALVEDRYGEKENRKAKAKSQGKRKARAR